MSTGKVTEDILMRRIDTYGLVSPTKAKIKLGKDYSPTVMLEHMMHEGGAHV